MITRVFDIPQFCLNNYPVNTIFAVKQSRGWKKYSTGEYLEISESIANGFLAIGIKNGDRIATISSRNLPEWNFVDMGIGLAGAIHVPIYPFISETDLRFIFKQSGVRYVFVSGEKVWNRIQPVVLQLPEITGVYSFSGFKGLPTWEQLLQQGRDYRKTQKDALTNRKNLIHPDDVATIVYTSGTTGNPKGVMLTHENLVSNIIASSRLHPLQNRDKVLSFLPLSHVYERTANYQFQLSGVSIYYAEDIYSILKNLDEVKPQGFTAVPRVLEKIRKIYLDEGKKLTGLKGAFFRFSLRTATDYPVHHQLSFRYRIKRKIADFFVFKKLQRALGGRIKFIGCGGAKLGAGIEKFFWAAGLPLFQGYGLTETSPLITLNRRPRSKMKIGTVGPAIPGVELKIAPDGEILCRGPNIMKGYYREKKLTDLVIDKEGWFHTGDLGTFSADGFLRIRGRKKDLFKNSYGKYIAPQLIEGRFRESQLISQLMIIGEGMKFTSALITPDFDYLFKWVASNLKLQVRDRSKLVRIPQVIQLYQQEVKQINQSLGQSEQIKKFRILPDVWSIQSGEFSASLKLKRHFILKKYRQEIKEIYEN